MCGGLLNLPTAKGIVSCDVCKHKCSVEGSSFLVRISDKSLIFVVIFSHTTPTELFESLFPEFHASFYEFLVPIKISHKDI